MKPYLLPLLLLLSNSLFSQNISFQNTRTHDGYFDYMTAEESHFVDINNDGWKDFVVSGYNYHDSIHVYINNGAGGFKKESSGVFLNAKDGAMPCDLDGDGDVDILAWGILNGTSTRVLYFYENDGGGGFTEILNPTIQTIKGQELEVFDADGDGDLDIFASGFQVTNNAALFLNDGNLNFSLQPNSFLTLETGGADIADVDLDGDLDICLSGGQNYFTSLSNIYLNDGNGIFTNSSNTIQPLEYSHVEFVDIDNDNDPDLYISGNYSWPSSGSRFCKIYENDGTGNFTVTTNLPITYHTNGSSKFQDLNNDGYKDAVFTGTSPLDFNLFINQGDGTFLSAPSPFPLGVGDVAIEDVNNDGNMDVYVSTKQNWWDRNNNLFIGDGNLNFTQSNFDEIEPMRTDLSNMVDLNNDGKLDFISVGMAISTGGTFIYKNIGNAKFERIPSTGLDHIDWNFYDHADVNGDGLIDLFQLGQDTLNGNGYETPEIYINQGNFHFIQHPTPFPVPHLQNSDYLFGDADNDGDEDFLILGFDGITPINQIYLNDGTGAFTLDPSHSGSGIYQAYTEFIDIDLDGDLDFFTTGQEGSGQQNAVNFLYINDGSGGFSEFTGHNIQPIKNGEFGFGDFDNDGDLDICINGYDYSNFEAVAKIFLNDGNQIFTELIGTNFTALNNSNIKVADLDNDGDQDIIMNGSNSVGDKVTHIYENQGGNQFFQLNSAYIIGTINGSISMGDANNDGYTDFIITGKNSFLGQSEVGLYINTSCQNKIIDTLTACDSLLWDKNNQQYFASVVDTAFFTNSNGCDSIHILNLTILNANDTSVIDTSCNIMNSPSGNYSWTSSGIYTDTLSNQIGCDSVISIDLTIRENAASITISNDTIFADTVQSNYYWFNCDNTSIISGENDVYYSPYQSGNYAVITDDTVCRDTSICAYIEVCPDLYININNQTIPTFGLSDGALFVEVTNGTPHYTYLWPFNSSTDSIQLGLASNLYEVQVIDGNGCEGGRFIPLYEVDTTIVNSPVVDTLVSDTMDICVPFNVVNSAIYDWHINPQDSTVLLLNWIFYDSVGNVFIVEVPYDISTSIVEGNFVAILNMNCQDGLDNNKANIEIWDIFYFSPFDGQYASIYKEDFDCKIYPNPTSEIIKIEFAQSIGSFKVRVKNVSGQILKEYKFDQLQNEIILDYTPGIYFLEFQTSKGRFIEKIIKN